jgi:hypothetical protein
MNRTCRLCAIAVMLLLFAACGSSGPAAPTATNPPPTVPPPTLPTTVFPPLSGPSRTFSFDHELSYPVHDYTRQSRLVLYDNGAFALQYLSLSGEGYRGAYQDTNGVLVFEWQGGNGWSATGILKAGSLTVRYNTWMSLSDFEDAVYSPMP